MKQKTIRLILVLTLLGQQVEWAYGMSSNSLRPLSLVERNNTQEIQPASQKTSKQARRSFRSKLTSVLAPALIAGVIASGFPGCEKPQPIPLESVPKVTVQDTTQNPISAYKEEPNNAMRHGSPRYFLAQANLLYELNLPLTELQRLDLLEAYETTRSRLVYGKYVELFIYLLDLPDIERVTHKDDSHPVVYASPENPKQIYFRVPNGPGLLFLNLEKDKGLARFDGALGTREEFAVAFRDLPGPLKHRLMRNLQTPKLDAELIANVKAEWQRLANATLEARTKSAKLQFTHGKPRPKCPFPKEQELDKVSFVGMNGFGITSGKSTGPFLDTFDINTCVVCTLWDPKTQVGGMAHFRWSRDPEPGMKRFLEMFKRAVQEAGGQVHRDVQVRLIGGVRESIEESIGMSEGLVVRLLELLEGFGILIEKDVLGEKSRRLNIRLDTQSGQVFDLILGSQGAKSETGDASLKKSSATKILSNI